MKKVLVVGDTILDVYVNGVVERISPECPVPILDIEYTTEMLGGACNVAANIKSISKEDVLVEYIGYVSPKIRGMLDKAGVSTQYSLEVNEKEVLTKTRFVSDKHQLLRVDKNRWYIFPNKTPSILDVLKSLDYSQFDLLIVSDYGKGTINHTKEFEFICELPIPRIIDLKKPIPLEITASREKFEKLCIKCNEKEWNLIESSFFEDPVYYFFNYVVTLGSGGHLIEQGGKYHPRYPSYSNGFVNDVVGAGDVFLASMAVWFFENNNDFNLEKMSDFGAKAAAAKIKHFGTVQVQRGWLQE